MIGVSKALRGLTGTRSGFAGMFRKRTDLYWTNYLGRESGTQSEAGLLTQPAMLHLLTRKTLQNADLKSLVIQSGKTIARRSFVHHACAYPMD